MSEEIKQVAGSKSLISLWIIFILFYLGVCSLAGLYVVSLEKKVQTARQQVRIARIQKFLKQKGPKGFKENNRIEQEENLYSQSGAINPMLRKKADLAQGQAGDSDIREYQQQLAEYRLKLAEQRQRELEQKRKEEELRAQRIALLEQERQERLKERQELQKSQSLISAVEGVDKTPKTSQTKQQVKKTVSVQPATPQKTQIGTLKKSKLGESSFQNKSYR